MYIILIKNNMDNNNTMMMYITLHVERASYNKGGMLEGPRMNKAVTINHLPTRINLSVWP